jgi:hypothetical protein
MARARQSCNNALVGEPAVTLQTLAGETLTNVNASVRIVKLS